MTYLDYFNENGFVLKRKLFSKEEIDKLNNFVEHSYGKEGTKKTISTTGSANLTLGILP